MASRSSEPRSVWLESYRPVDTFSNALVVGDDRQEVARLVATLRVLLGYEIKIRTANSVNAAINELLHGIPQIVVMDDVLQPDHTATQSIPMLRRANYAGPILIVSRLTSVERTTRLVEIGAAAVINKDNLDASAVGDALWSCGLLTVTKVNTKIGR